MHLEKGSAYAARGVFLPPYDTRETLARLAAVIDRYDAETVICLGDSFHDVAGAERMGAEEAETLAIMQEDREWIWLTGNHDPEIPDALGGHVVGDLDVGGLALRHTPTASPVTHEIAGHLHPAARISYCGHVIRRPCFVGNGLRLVLPAFGTFTGGLNVLDEAFAPLFGDAGLSVWVLGQEGLYPVATRLLRED
jgi:DNA ligase-associated metallophosphoesterase